MDFFERMQAKKENSKKIIGIFVNRVGVGEGVEGILANCIDSIIYILFSTCLKMYIFVDYFQSA